MAGTLRVTPPRRCRHLFGFFDCLFHFDGRLGFRLQARRDPVVHSFRPDVKAAAAFAADFPRPPDAFTLVESLVEDVVLAQVLLGPVPRLPSPGDGGPQPDRGPAARL